MGFCCVMVVAVGWFWFADWLRTGDERRKRLKEFVEHLASREQLFDRDPDLNTIIAGLFEGTIVAVRGHFLF
jgi:hypothetical protein